MPPPAPLPPLNRWLYRLSVNPKRRLRKGPTLYLSGSDQVSAAGRVPRTQSVTRVFAVRAFPLVPDLSSQNGFTLRLSAPAFASGAERHGAG